MPSSNKKSRNRRVEHIGKLIENPSQFASVFLGQDVWSKQGEILQSVATRRRTAVKACHASGKTFTAAGAVLWWITRFPKAIAVTTAPTWMQVERLLWGEIHNALRNSKIEYPQPSATKLQLAPDRYAIGISTNEGVRFQGFHGNVLVVLDEAPGVISEIWEAIEGIRAGGDVRVLALGNPTIASGPFYDAFTSQRETWNQITISAFDTPNFEGLDMKKLLMLSDEELDCNVRPYLTSRRWVKEKFREWGPGHPLWESRVMGRFPAQAADALLSLAWLEAAKMSAAPGIGNYRAGLDVAGPGEDETVLTIRQGSRIVAHHAWKDADPRGKLIAALMPYKPQLEVLNVDSIGMGYGMFTHLRDIFGCSVVRSINVGESASDKERYVNRKAELYWGLRMRAEAGDLSGLSDERAIGQLAGIRYSHNARGQIVIESKEDARKRGVKSPDRAESIMLAFADVRRPFVRISYFTNYGWQSISTEDPPPRERKPIPVQNNVPPPPKQPRRARNGFVAEKTIRVKMLKTREGSPDGRNICTYREGEEYELPADPSPGPDLGLVMIQEKWAVEVKEGSAGKETMRVKMLETREGSPDGRNIYTYRKGEEYELPAGPWPRPDLGLIMIQEKWAVEVKQVDADSICSEPVKAETAADSDGARRPEPIEFK